MRVLRLQGVSGSSPREVPRANLLPAGYRPAPVLTLRNGLLFLVFLELLIAVYITRVQGDAALGGVRQYFQDLRGEQSVAEQRLVNLNGQVAGLEKQLEQLKSGRKTITDRRGDWPAAISALLGSTSEGLSITALRQGEGIVQINGQADSLELVNAFRARLLLSGRAGGALITSLAQEKGTGKTVFSMTVGLQ